MRKDKLYFFTFFAIATVFLIIASLGLRYFTIESANQLINIQLESSRREVNEISQLIAQQIDAQIDPELVKYNVQSVIEGTQDMSSFVSVIDWAGKQVCHPDITKVGENIKANQDLLKALNEKGGASNLYKMLLNYNKDNDPIVTSEIVKMVPVEGTDLIVLAHSNLNKIASQVQELESRFYIIFFFMGGGIILFSFIAVRIIGSLYEKQLELKNTNLEIELINLSKLNTNLVEHQQKISDTYTNEENQSELNVSDFGKKRLLTYIRNELVPIPLNDVAYIQTEHGITYIYCINGKKSTSNLSLEEVFNYLDHSLFFRANRQYIIGITAIEKIIRYGNSQLKILMKGADVDIIISKNRAAEFKQWLSI